jgi:hypothetical protein
MTNKTGLRVTDLCPSPHIEALDIGDNLGDEMLVTFDHVEEELIGGEMRYVIFFAEFQRGLILNRTVSRSIQKMYGSEIDNWVGKKMTLYRSETPVGGEVKPCVRVRETKPQ